MNSWHWFWSLVGFLIYIIVLIFLFFYQPFEDLVKIVLYGLSYDNVMFWAALIIGIVGFCLFHWEAYRLHIVRQHRVEAMILTSLRGSTFVAIVLSGGATLQAVQILNRHLLDPSAALDSEFGARLFAVVGLIVLTGLFCIIFWLLKVIHHDKATDRLSGART